MPPTILLIRHGNTTFDNKVDAHLDPPLNGDGVERIKRTKKFLDGSDYKVARIVSSPLQRSLKAALMIADGNKQVTTNVACKPWDLGELMGKEVDKVKPQIDYLQNYPDLRAPHGESYRTFYTRWTRFLQKVMDYAEAKPNEAIIVTTHSRNINSLQEYIDGNPIGDVKESTPEGSITLLAKTGLDWSHKIIWEGN